MKKSILLTGLAATLACGGSQLSGGNDKAASSSLQISSPSTPTLTADECNFFGKSGPVQICHVTGSGFTATVVDTSGCLNHTKFVGDYIAAGSNCSGNKAWAASTGGACFPAGAPLDPIIPCCSGVDDGNGHCADVCTGEWSGSNPIPYSLVVPNGALCRLDGVEVGGKTIVKGGLFTIGSTFDGDVSVTGAGSSLTSANQGNTFNGNLSITGSDGNGYMNGFWSDYSATTIFGNFTYTGNAAPLYVQSQGGFPIMVKGDFKYSYPCSWNDWWWYVSNPYWEQITVGGQTTTSCF